MRAYYGVGLKLACPNGEYVSLLTGIGSQGMCYQVLPNAHPPLPWPPELVSARRVVGGQDPAQRRQYRGPWRAPACSQSAMFTITELTTEIDNEIRPFHRIRQRLSTIPGVSDRIAEVIIAETGGDPSRFATAQQLASWAGVCPGNNESAGNHFTGRTRKGDRWLRGALGEAAAAAARTKSTYLSSRYRRLASRRGKKRAKVAIGHDILIAGWHIPSRDVDYHALGADYFDIHAIDPRRKATRITQQLHALGYRVTLEPVAWSDGLVIFES